MYFKQVKEDNFHIKNAVYGEITGGCSKGVFLTLNNGQDAFSSFCTLAPGTKVLCTVLKRTSHKNRALVSIDSVLNERTLTA